MFFEDIDKAPTDEFHGSGYALWGIPSRFFASRGILRLAADIPVKRQQDRFLPDVSLIAAENPIKPTVSQFETSEFIELTGDPIQFAVVSARNFRALVVVLFCELFAYVAGLIIWK